MSAELRKDDPLPEKESASQSATDAALDGRNSKSATVTGDHSVGSTPDDGNTTNDNNNSINDIDVEKPQGQPEGVPIQDENIVDWDGDNDPKNPYNWPTWLKVINCILVSFLCFLAPLGSCKSYE